MPNAAGSMLMSLLESEIEPAPDHSEVVVVVSEIPAHVRHPANVPGETDFQSAAHLTERASVIVVTGATEGLFDSDEDKAFMVPAPYRATAAKNVRGKTGTSNRETKGQSA